MVALWVGAVSAAEAPKPKTVDDAIAGLFPKEGPERKAEELEADYQFVVGELAKGLAGDDMSKWAASDTKLEALTHQASTPGRDAHRLAAAKALLASIRAPGLTALGSERVIRHIERIGRAEAVPALTELLADKDLREPARRALMNNPAPAAAEALRAALPKADKPFRIALINALGFRRDAASVQLLIAEAKSDDDGLRVNACDSLGLIGDGAAAEALAAAMAKGPIHTQIRATNASLALADALAIKGEKDAALKIYRSLLGPKTYVKCAALVGIGRAGSAKDAETLIASVITPNAQERGAAVQGLILLPGKEATTAIADRAKTAEAGVKAVLLGVLGRRGDPAAAPVVVEAANDADIKVRIAAFQALGELKAEAAIPACLSALKGAVLDERDAAERALSKVPGRKATEAIVAALADARKQARCVLLRSLGYRKDADTLPTLVAATKDADEDVRIAAFMAIGQLNQVKAVPVILEALGSAEGKVKEAVAYALRRTTGPEANAAIVEAAKKASPAALAVILQIMSWREDPSVKELLLAGARHADLGVRAAAIEGLARVKDPGIVPLLIEAATKGEGVLRDTAVRTALQYSADIIKADRAAAATIFGLALDRKIVPQPDDQKIAIRALGEVGGTEVIPALAQGFRDHRVSGEAHDAVQRIAEGLAKAGKKEAAVEAYTEIVRRSNDQGRISRAQGELRKLGVEGDLAHRAGFITRWMVAGPFPNPNNALFGQQLPPEKEGVDVLLAAEAAGVSREWKPLQTADPSGIVDLNTHFGKQANAGALLYAEVTVAKDAEALLKLGYEEGCVACVNGKQVHSRVGANFRIDEQRVKVQLKAGANKLLLKVGHLERGWVVCARLVGADDGPIEFKQQEK
jgi:HEAT repeat protein